ncbi:MAG: ABC transporter permease [Anaerolineales bacterium]|nr:ABC transporter permease [Anaerolineales bacterium]
MISHRLVNKNTQLVIGISIIIFYILIAIFAPIISKQDPLKQNLNIALQGINKEHYFGTDELGRDLFSRVIYGFRISLYTTSIIVFISSALGVCVGIIVGFYGGVVDLLIMRIVDILMAFPGLILAMVIVSVLGSSIRNMMIAVIIYTFPGFIVISRSAAFKVKKLDYVEAARALGSSNIRIVIRHILPNCLIPIIVQITLRAGAVILMSSGLSFLGLGVPRPTPDWGLILSDGRQYLRTAPHIMFFSGISIVLIVLGFNLVGEGITNSFLMKR